MKTFFVLYVRKRVVCNWKFEVFFRVDRWRYLSFVASCVVAPSGVFSTFPVLLLENKDFAPVPKIELPNRIPKKFCLTYAVKGFFSGDYWSDWGLRNRLPAPTVISQVSEIVCFVSFFFIIFWKLNNCTSNSAVPVAFVVFHALAILVISPVILRSLRFHFFVRNKAGISSTFFCVVVWINFSECILVWLGPFSADSSTRCRELSGIKSDGYFSAFIKSYWNLFFYVLTEKKNVYWTSTLE